MDIPDIDSSKWSTDPRKYGMSPREYIRSETHAFFHDFLGRSGLNKFYHFKGLTKAADRWVVSPNNDTIYSIVVVNASQGFKLKLPEVGKRFISTQIITENHMTPSYVYGGGVRKFSAEDFDTKFVGVGVRIGTTGTPEDVKTIVEKLQPQYAIEGAATDGSLPKVDMATLPKVRAALIKEYSKLPNSFDTMVKHTKDVKDWERFTYVTAGAWGLSADENAMYAIGGPQNAEGGTCYKATFPKVPAKAFFSIHRLRAREILDDRRAQHRQPESRRQDEQGRQLRCSLRRRKVQQACPQLRSNAGKWLELSPACLPPGRRGL